MSVGALEGSARKLGGQGWEEQGADVDGQGLGGEEQGVDLMDLALKGWERWPIAELARAAATRTDTAAYVRLKRSLLKTRAMHALQARECAPPAQPSSLADPRPRRSPSGSGPLGGSCPKAAVGSTRDGSSLLWWRRV